MKYKMSRTPPKISVLEHAQDFRVKNTQKNLDISILQWIAWMIGFIALAVLIYGIITALLS